MNISQFKTFVYEMEQIQKAIFSAEQMQVQFQAIQEKLDNLQEQNTVESTFEQMQAQFQAIQEKLNNLQGQNSVSQNALKAAFDKCTILQKKLDSVLSQTQYLQKQSSILQGVVAKTAPKKMIQHLDFHLVEHCNLNCKGCSTFSPIAEKKFADLTSFKNDISRLHQLVGNRILRIHLLGGEPLLHPEIERFAIECRSIFPEARIDFTTNGTLVFDMPESFWKVLHEYNVALKYTRYPINFDYDKMVSFVKEKGVEVYSAGGQIKYFRRIPMNPSGIYNIMQSYVKCPYSDCAQLRDGKLFLCPVSAFSTVLNAHIKKSARTESFPLTSNDYVDLYQADSAQDVFDFISSPVAFCQYCDLNHMDASVPWDASGRNIEEWVDF